MESYRDGRIRDHAHMIPISNSATKMIAPQPIT
jgi:hypothetical protein